MLCPYNEKDGNDNDDKDDNVIMIAIYEWILLPSSSILNHPETFQRKIWNKLLMSGLGRRYIFV
jgi:hypothetical protein